MEILLLAAIVVISGYGQEVMSVFVRPRKHKSWADQYHERQIREGKRF